ncbi:MAG: FHA domain-containing protein [Acidobacteriota bacterium]|nr:FHA domain-containing protein [Acidobacteriota bacterium]
MNTLEPIAVALKFGFLAVLYLFLLWVARSAARDLRGRSAGRELAGTGPGSAQPGGREVPMDATGLHAASAVHGYDVTNRAPRLVVCRAPGHEPGMIYDIDSDVVLGRGDRAEVRLEDPFASARHAHIFSQGGLLAIEDLGSTNGTYLNEELLDTPRPLHPGDRVRIGDSEFAFEID